MDFVDDFRYHRDPAAVEQPVESGEEDKDAVLAGTIETVCDEMGILIPDWLRNIPACREPLFLSRVETVKAFSLAESPVHFRIRKVFVMENFLHLSDQTTIRQATLLDAEVLTDLSYATFWDAFSDHPKNAPDDLADYMGKAFNIGQIASELADENSLFFIAELDGKPAGYAKVIRGTTEDGITAKHPIELSRLYSHQEFLGKGVGRDLMTACLDYAKTHEHDVMWLGVWEYNPRAQAFYTKNGFREVGKHTFQLGSDPQTDLLMQRSI